MLRMITLLFSGKSLQAEIKDGTNNILYFMFYGQSITRLFVQFSSLISSLYQSLARNPPGDRIFIANIKWFWSLRTGEILLDLMNHVCICVNLIVISECS